VSAYSEWTRIKTIRKVTYVRECHLVVQNFCRRRAYDRESTKLLGRAGSMCPPNVVLADGDCDVSCSSHRLKEALIMGDKKASHYTKTQLGRMKNVLWWLVPAIQGYSAYLYSRRTSSFPQSSSGAAFVQTYFFGRFNGIQ
jgi:hypothetical protein